MTWDDFLTVFFSFCGAVLGSGVVVAAVEWLKAIESDRARLRVEHFGEQLNKLYGPLNFWISSNVELVKLNGLLRDAYDSVFVHVTWSSNPDTRDQLDRETKACIVVMNKYTEAVVENNRRIANLIRDNYNLADDDDQEDFQTIVLNATRMELELAGDENASLPYRIGVKLERPLIFSSEICDRLRSKCKEKVDRLREYRRPWLWQKLKWWGKC